MFVDADIQLISDEVNFLQKIEDFQSISRISINLKPPNPNHQPEFEHISRRIEELNVSTYREEFYASREEGMDAQKVSRDRELTGKFKMALNSYGLGRITGILKNGNPKTISTDQNPTTQKFVESDNIEEDVLPKMLDKLKELMARFNNKARE